MLSKHVPIADETFHGLYSMKKDNSVGITTKLWTMAAP
jgi:hypothetical protein